MSDEISQPDRSEEVDKLISSAHALQRELRNGDAAAERLADHVEDLDLVDSARQELNRRLHADPTDTHATDALRVIGDVWARLAPNESAISRIIDESG